MGIKLRQLAVGRDHCLALTSDGQVYAWGDNSKHQLGVEVNIDNEEENFMDIEDEVLR